LSGGLGISVFVEVVWRFHRKEIPVSFAL